MAQHAERMIFKGLKSGTIRAPMGRRKFKGKSSIARSLKPKQKKEVKKLIHNQIIKDAETKYIDSVVGPAAAITAAPQLFLVSVPAQGNADSQRNGDEIICRNLELRFSIYSTSTCNFRFIFGRWNPSTTTGPPTTALILQSIVANTQVVSPYVHDQLDQWDLLWDVTGHLDVGSNLVKEYKKVIKLYDKKLQFEAATSNGQFKYFYMHMGNALAGGALPTYDAVWRLNYFDP